MLFGMLVSASFSTDMRVAWVCFEDFEIGNFSCRFPSDNFFHFFSIVCIEYAHFSLNFGNVVSAQMCVQNA